MVLILLFIQLLYAADDTAVSPKSYHETCKEYLQRYPEIAKTIASRTSFLRMHHPILVATDPTDGAVKHYNIHNGFFASISRKILTNHRKFLEQNINDYISAFGILDRGYLHLDKQVRSEIDRQIQANQKERKAIASHYIEELKRKLSSEAIKKIESDLIIPAITDENHVAHSWNSILSTNLLDVVKPELDAVGDLLSGLLREIDEKYPILKRTELPIPDDLKNLRDFLEEYKSETMLTRLSDVLKRNGLEVQLDNATLHFNEAIGTVEVNPHQISEQKRKNQSLYLQDGPRFVFLHGAGSNISTAASFINEFPMVPNPWSFDLPNSGHGLPLSGYKKQNQYVDYVLRYRQAKDEHTFKSAPLPPPLVTFGRSMGSTYGYNHMLDSYLAGSSSVPLYLLSSFSNPLNMEVQIKNIYYYLAKGEFTMLVEKTLDEVQRYMNEMIARLDQEKVNDPENFALFGNVGVFIQGNADEDGGEKQAVVDLKTFRDRYSPLTQVYELDDPIQDLPGSEERNIYSYEKEATHSLLSSLPDLKAKDLEKPQYEKFRGISEENLPKKRSQTLEILALMFARIDYMADGRPHGKPWPSAVEREAQKTLALYREVYCKDAQGMPLKCFDWFIRQQGTTMADIEVTVPSRLSLVARFSRVYTRMQDHRREVETVYRSKGL